MMPASKIWDGFKELTDYLDSNEKFLLWQQYQYMIQTGDWDPLALHLYKMVENRKGADEIRE